MKFNLILLKYLNLIINFKQIKNKSETSKFFDNCKLLLKENEELRLKCTSLKEELL